MTRELDEVIIRVGLLLLMLLLLGKVRFGYQKFFYDLVVETVDVRVKWVGGIDS